MTSYSTHSFKSNPKMTAKEAWTRLTQSRAYIHKAKRVATSIRSFRELVQPHLNEPTKKGAQMTDREIKAAVHEFCEEMEVEETRRQRRGGKEPESTAVLDMTPTTSIRY